MKTRSDRSKRAGGCLIRLALGVAVWSTAARADIPATKPAHPAETAKPNQSAKQVADVQKFLAELRKPTTDAELRGMLVAQLLEMGDEGPKRLAMQCERDFKSKHPAYLAKIEKGAADALKLAWKGKGDIEKEVADLRKTVLDVSKSANLTKAMIVEKSDPAMAKLADLLTVKPEAVTEAQPELKALRQEVLDLAATWSQAVEKLPEENRKTLSASVATPPDAKAIEADLTSKETLAAMLATPMPKADRDTLLANIPLAEKLDPEEANGIQILNLMRLRLGLGVQAIDPKLVDASKGHSKDMSEKKFFAHDSPVSGKEDPWKRAKLAGTTANAENIFVGNKRGAEAIKAWWYSPGHHKNMLGGGHRVGLGRFEGHWTQMFG